MQVNYQTLLSKLVAMMPTIHPWYAGLQKALAKLSAELQVISSFWMYLIHEGLRSVTS